MKFFSGLLLILLPISNSLAQSAISEFGVFAGASYYMGDINKSRHFYKPRPAFNLFYRHNLNEHYSLKAAAAYAKLSASDSDSDWPYQQLRNRSADFHYVDISLIAAFNFLPYKPGNTRKNYWCPYVMSGISYAVIPNTITLPMGGGAKYNINKQWSVSCEWIFCRMFSDKSDISLIYNISGQQVSNSKDKDWVNMAWVSVSYNIDLLTKCRAYD